MNKFAIAAILGAGLLMAPVAASAKYGPSFNCRYASNSTERAICNSRRLSRLDRKLDHWYWKAQERARYFDQSRWLRRQQRAWLRRRNACGGNRFCIGWKYRWRVRQLRRYFNHV